MVLLGSGPPESNEGFDSTDGADIAAAHPPAGAVIFYYVNGRFEWGPADLAPFPADEYRLCPLAVYIPGQDVTGVDADVLDVEAQYIDGPNRGDCLSQSAAWSARRRREGKIPGWYTGTRQRADLENVVGPGAWFLADWTAVAHSDEIPGEDVVATQFASPTVPVAGEGHYDLSQIDNARFDAWYDHNHGIAPPPDPTAPGGMCMLNVPQLAERSTGPAVAAAQRLLGAVTVDGIFGPVTKARTIQFQQSHGLTGDGIVGTHTWGALLGSPQ